MFTCGHFLLVLELSLWIEHLTSAEERFLKLEWQKKQELAEA